MADLRVNVYLNDRIVIVSSQLAHENVSALRPGWSWIKQNSLLHPVTLRLIQMEEETTLLVEESSLAMQDYHIQSASFRSFS